MAARLRLWVKVAVLAGLVLVVGGLAVGGWLFWRRPLFVDAWMSRLALGSAGLRSSRIEAPAGEMTVWQGGSGPATVLLHGAGDQAGAWARIVRPLVGRYRVVIPDLPGHAKSAPRRGPIGVDQLLAGVTALMDEYCRDQPAILVGNSLGAWLAFLYAREHPERVARLVAVNGGPLREQNSAVNIFPADRDQARATMRALMGPNTPMPPGFVLDDVARWAKTGPAARLAETADQMERYVLDGRLGEVTVPVELLWGGADGLMPLGYAQRMLEGLPAARLTVLKDCGHVPQRECPDRLLQALMDVLDQPPPTPAAAPVPPAEVR